MLDLLYAFKSMFMVYIKFPDFFFLNPIFPWFFPAFFFVFSDFVATMILIEEEQPKLNT